ncbi:LuxR C-terminal-related transcriptional regulator (plasmid) [Pantoea dispersa]|uniref:helix-turn-helix transcriptional regulator n=1 Tax=Pantoea dispersa TaxID=59814 RepID=UPI001CA76916|nr:LuxR C-terminal-related transcriptional regulator [Pantoea dispersa]QZY92931.1 LuxR C-terminal-related transcriptional regulator [Pantoea dispersa]
MSERYDNRIPIKIFSDNAYLIKGISEIIGNKLNIEVYSINYLISNKKPSVGLTVIDLDSWEKSSIGKIKSLEKTFEKNNEVLIICNTKFQEIMVNILYRKALHIIKSKSLLIFRLLAQGYSLNELHSSLIVKDNVYLTKKQMQIVRCLITIGCQKEICSILGINSKTLYNHIKVIMNKLGARKTSYFLTFIKPFWIDLKLGK